MKKIIVPFVLAFIALNLILTFSEDNLANDVSYGFLTKAMAGSDESSTAKGGYDLFNCRWTITTIKYDSDGNKIVVGTEVKTCKNCGYNCDFDKTGNCETPVLCDPDEEIVE